MIKKIINELKELSRIDRRPVFFCFLIFTCFLSVLDIVSTQTAIWRYGAWIEMNPTVREIFMISPSPLTVLLLFDVCIFTVIWILHRYLPFLGWILLITAFTLEFYANLWNFYLKFWW